MRRCGERPDGAASRGRGPQALSPAAASQSRLKASQLRGCTGGCRGRRVKRWGWDGEEGVPPGLGEAGGLWAASEQSHPRGKRGCCGHFGLSAGGDPVPGCAEGKSCCLAIPQCSNPLLKVTTYRSILQPAAQVTTYSSVLQPTA